MNEYNIQMKASKGSHYNRRMSVYKWRLPKVLTIIEEWVYDHWRLPDRAHKIYANGNYILNAKWRPSRFLALFLIVMALYYDQYSSYSFDSRSGLYRLQLCSGKWAIHSFIHSFFLSFFSFTSLFCWFVWFDPVVCCVLLMGEDQVIKVLY